MYTEEDHSKVDNPNLRTVLPYPRMVYHAELGTLVVKDEAEHKAAAKRGYEDEPIMLPEPETVEPVTLESLDARMERLETMLGTILEQQERLENLLEAPKKGKGRKSEPEQDEQAA